MRDRLFEAQSVERAQEEEDIEDDRLRLIYLLSSFLPPEVRVALASTPLCCTCGAEVGIYSARL
jgi:predicted RNA polymerase sigma factor